MIKNKKSVEKSSEAKSWFFEKIDKMDKLIVRLRKEEGGYKLLRNERGHHFRCLGH